jgi:hypothetical protein
MVTAAATKSRRDVSDWSVMASSMSNLYQSEFPR